MPPRSLPSAAFEDVAFWDARYSVDGEAFDWYEQPSIGVAMAAIETALSLSVSSASSSASAAAASTFSLLDIGCGTSLLAERIAEERGQILFERIVACDASQVAIEQQRQRQEERRESRAAAARAEEEGGGGGKEQPDSSTVVAVSYEVADAFELPYGDGNFDAVVDKGTADALDCAGCGDKEEEEEEEEGEGGEDEEKPPPSSSSSALTPSLSPPSSSFPPAARVIAEASRVLRPGGLFVMVSCREPERRRKDFARARELTASTSTSATGEEESVLVLSSIVGEIRKRARDPCPNAHVYVAVKSRRSSRGGGGGKEGGEGNGGAAAAAAAAGELADAAARAAASAAAAITEN